MSNFSEQELNELRVELNQIDEEFSELNSLFDSQLFSSSEDDSEELDALNAALEDSGLEEASTGGNNQLSLLDALDGDFSSQSLEMQGIFGAVKRFLKKKVAKLIRKIVRLVKKYSRLRVCVPAVLKAVALFKAGKYARALRAAYKAYRCIKKRL